MQKKIRLINKKRGKIAKLIYVEGLPNKECIKDIQKLHKEVFDQSDFTIKEM
ncbi:hypothetical protein [Rummeliibacillus pycnus]|uniref:hypothetical protein n=1 Tax=Rummeliibacillus pycnus TaxID=101070 RepID=UPI0014730578|nr:hypothetical protein [Rummeliibacillus pycnus]